MNWYLAEEDLRKAERLLAEERVYPVTYENMFCVGIYCILSAAEKYTKCKTAYQKILSDGLNTPSRIVSRREDLGEALAKLRFPNTKRDRVYRFALWWSKSFLPEQILKDINLGKKEEFRLRNRLAEECPGIWYKGASLFMIKCGYENVVPLDLWMLRFLKQLGYEVEVPDYKTKSGPRPKEYLEYERIVVEIANDHGVSPALFQFAVWSKHSSWNSLEKSKG